MYEIIKLWNVWIDNIIIFVLNDLKKKNNNRCDWLNKNP